MTAEAPIRTQEEQQHAAGSYVYFFGSSTGDSSFLKLEFMQGGASGTATPSIADRIRFNDLADWWHAETDGLSIDSQKFDHEAYQRILRELGGSAVPFMIDDLRERGGHWYSALRHLTGESVDAKAGGSMRRARDLWLKWAKAKHL